MASAEITTYEVEAFEDGRWRNVGLFDTRGSAELMSGYRGTRSRVALPIRITEVTTTTSRRLLDPVTA